MHGAVFFADDVPARLRLPSGSPDSRLEQVGFGDALGRPNELLLLLRKVSAEILRALRTQPDTSIHDFDVGEDVGRRELGLLRLRCFIGVRSEDRKSTRLNSSHGYISYAVFCLKKKKKENSRT